MEKDNGLSQREQEILSLLANGASNKDIAARLNISANTVKVHLRNIYAKIEVSSRTEATLYAVKSGLIRPVPAVAAPESEENPPPQPLQSQTARPNQMLFIAAMLLALVATLFVAGQTGLKNQPASNPSGVSSLETASPRRWQRLPALPEPRQGMAAALFEEHIYLIGGETPQGITSSVIAFAPETGVWQTRADKPLAVSGVQAARLGDQIYIPGGTRSNGRPSDQLAVYFPRSDQWETHAALPVSLTDYALTAFEGKLFLFGGWDGNNHRGETYMYSPETDAWTSLSSLPAPRSGASAVSEGGKIYLIGGTDGDHFFQDVLAYYPQRDLNGEPAWESLPPLPEGRANMGTAALAGSLYLVGGNTAQSQTASDPLQYRPQEARWQTFDSPPQAAGSFLALVPYEDFLHVLGGSTSTGLSDRHQVYQAIYTRAIPIILP